MSTSTEIDSVIKGFYCILFLNDNINSTINQVCWKVSTDKKASTCADCDLMSNWQSVTVYPQKYAHGFVVLCFVVVMQSFIMNSHEVFIHIHQGCFAGTGAIVRLPQCQWSKPDGYGKISQCITTTKHSKANTVCIFLGIYCTTRLCNGRKKVLNKLNHLTCSDVSELGNNLFR